MTNQIENSQVPTTDSYTPEFGYGGFWRRFIASMLDGFIIGLVTSPLTYSVTSHSTTSSTSTSNSLPTFLISAAYILFFWVYQNGQTLGKKIMGLRIVKENGQSLDFPTAVTRYFGYLISAAVFCLGLISAAFNPKKQGWHDKMANTIVIKTDNRSHLGWTIFISIIIAIAFVSLISAIALGIFVAKKVTTSTTSLPSELTKLIPTNTENENKNLQFNVAKLIDEKRNLSNLKPIVEDNVLCAYAQRRLSQLQAFGRYDDGKGFYEDNGNTETNKTYFRGYSTLGENVYTKNTLTKANDVMTNWLSGTELSNLVDPAKTFGCLRSDANYLVFISATPAKK